MSPRAGPQAWAGGGGCAGGWGLPAKMAEGGQGGRDWAQSPEALEGRPCSWQPG